MRRQLRVGPVNPGSGTGGQRARAQRLDVLLGLLGFFTVMAAVQTVVLEFRGDAAVGSALLLAGLAVALRAVWRARRKADS
ncbi:hypothetical protein ABZ615_10720 [Streptomyces sp. NPDC007325]|uniref:hypothetical protein n=1 Tax=Streptomyces sp. NPDC007325 TaxID=3154588 RepID=UPI0033EA7780